MATRVWTLVLTAWGIGAPTAARAQAPPTAHGDQASATGQSGTAQVMIVGVAHLVSRRDVHNSVFTDSPRSPKRQAQIAAVIDRLARYRPTKVLIEIPMGDTVTVRQYRDFLGGHFSLGAGEPYQFGFRLAARAGDSAIYPIDTWGPTIVRDSSDSGKRINAWLMATLPKVSTPAFRALLARQDAIERDGSYLDLLRYLNTDAAIRANASLYSVVAGMGRDADGAGASYVAQWYTRNAYIFANISSVVGPGDRAVVFIGQGHEYLLRDFVRLDPSLTDVDPLEYLR